MPETNRLQLAIGLPMRHQDEFQRLLRDLYNPASPRFRKFLKPQQFADEFGPSEADYWMLMRFAEAHHFQVVAAHSNRLLLDVAASAADINGAFHITMKEYRHPTEGRNFYAPDSEPSVEQGLPVLHISGLDNYLLPVPQLRTGTRGAVPQAGTGSGPGASFLGNDFRAAYAPGVALTGHGQTVALVEFDTYYSNDIVNYESLAGIVPVPLTNVMIDGFKGPPQGGDNEVSLDIEMAVAMAPGLSSVMVYEAPSSSIAVTDDMLNRIATDGAANQISCSWLFPINAATDQIFQEMAAQGQSFFDAIGDYGAYAGAMAPKQADPFITQVGGTDLTAAGPGGAWVTERAWQLTSGGVSASVPIPYWQAGLDMSSNQGSTLWRNVPDVAMAGNNVCVVYRNGVTNSLAGTSCSAPLWAGFMALVNQQAAQNGNPPAGFINPIIYGIGQGSLYAACFHDVKTGNNTNIVSPVNYSAVPGYDLCTGWGSPAGAALINALAPVDGLLALPPGGLSFALTNDNAAAAGSQLLTLTNTGATPIAWAIGPVPEWIDFSASNGLLAANSGISLALTTAPNATNQPPGGHDVDLILSNLTFGAAHSVPIYLTVADPLIIAPANGIAAAGPAGGPLNLTPRTISISNAAASAINWTVNSSSGYLNVAPGGGTLAPGQAGVVTATLAPAVSNLLINSASGAVTFTDSATGFAQAVPFMAAAGNGGFETGDFTDWVFTGITNACFVSGGLEAPYIHSGAFAAVMGEPTNPATLSQSFPSVPGQLYLVSFWLDNPAGGNPNVFAAFCGGGALFVQTNMPRFAWTNMQFAVTAAGNSTSLVFSFLNKPDAFGFDDVTVTAIAPPVFSSVAASNGMVLFNWNASPQFSYQLQYKTNLSTPAWANLGPPIAAASGPVAAADPTPADPQRFYRLVMTAP
jgi:hypothetical protein